MHLRATTIPVLLTWTSVSLALACSSESNPSGSSGGSTSGGAGIGGRAATAGQTNGGIAGEPSNGGHSSAGGPGGGTPGQGGQTGGASGTSSGTGGEQAGTGGQSAGAGGGPPREFKWSTAAPCPLSRFEANGVVIDAELWLLGGFTSASLAVTRRIDIYNPETDMWRRGADLPAAETHIAAVAVGKDIIIAGGFAGSFGATRPPATEAVWRWNSATSQWTTGPSLPRRGAAFAWALLGTKLHLAGGLAEDGNTDASAHYVWDTAGAAEWTMAAPLPNARNHGGGAASGGIFYAIAGRHGWNEDTGDTDDVNAFDPDTNTWITRAPIPLERSEIGASTATLSDGRILVIGGSLPGIMPSDDVSVYDPAGNAWSTLPKLPEKRKGAVAVQIGDRIVVTTGSPTSVDPSATTFVGCCL